MLMDRDYSLKEAFPEFDRICRARESSVLEVMHFHDGRLQWDSQFCCPVHDWELEYLALFMDMIYSTDVWGVGSNKVCWKPTKSRGFEVRGYYHSLSPTTIVSFLWKLAWQLNQRFLLE